MALTAHILSCNPIRLAKSAEDDKAASPASETAEFAVMTEHEIFVLALLGMFRAFFLAALYIVLHYEKD